MPTPTVTNLAWQAANARRNYPIEDQSTKVDVNGNELPDALLTDLQLWFPASIAESAFVSSATITANLVTLTISGVSSRPLQNGPVAPGFVPLAAVTVVKPVAINSNYALQSFAPGVGGWVSLGTDVNSLPNGSWRFTDPSASALLPRAARAYPVTGVTSIGKLGFVDQLLGNVTFVSSATNQLVIEPSMEAIPGIGTVQAIVFRLNEEVGGEAIYSEFPSICGGQPESNSCKSPIISSINGVEPTCAGVVNLYVQEVVSAGGEADLTLSYAYTNQDTTEPVGTGAGHTLNFDYNLGLSNICQSPPTSLTAKQGTACDDPCAPFASPGPILGTSLDVTWSWTTGVQAEPPQLPGAVFLRFSPVCTLNVEGYDSVTFNGASSGVAWIGLPGSTVIQNPLTPAYTTGAQVNFIIPAASILMLDNSGYLCHEAQLSGTSSVPASCPKRFSNGSVHYLIPGGTPANDGTGHVSSFPSGFTKLAWGTTKTIAELVTMGLVIDNQLQFQAAHVVSGTGFAVFEIQGNFPSSLNLNTDPGCETSSGSLA